MSKVFPVINPNLIINSVSESHIILLDPESVSLYEMNTPGVFICSMCSGKEDLDEVKSRIIEHCCNNNIYFDEKVFNDFIQVLNDNNWIILHQQKRIDEVLDAGWTKVFPFKTFNPEFRQITDMSEGFFSKVFIDF